MEGQTELKKESDKCEGRGSFRPDSEEGQESASQSKTEPMGEVKHPDVKTENCGVKEPGVLMVPGCGLFGVLDCNVQGQKCVRWFVYRESAKPCMKFNVPQARKASLSFVCFH